MVRNELIPSENIIEEAIGNLKKSPGKFQRLCEMYAQLRYPERFKRIVPNGRRTDDVTIKGWPDAYAPVDGGIEALEVTHSPKWTGHLRDDREKVEKFDGKDIVGLLFISWFNNPKPETIDKYERELAALGIPRSNITFVFANELVFDLGSSGRFAKILSDILNLSPSPFPFDPVDNAFYLYGKKEDPGLSAPSLYEYHNKHVHRPRLTDKVEERLREKKWGIVRGKGASGKTSLALQIAHGDDDSLNITKDDKTVRRYSKAYYLNLAREEGSGDAVDITKAFRVINEFADEGTLFILDNIHLNEEHAALIFYHWETTRAGSRLLMLGREIKKAPNVKGTSEAFDDEMFRDNTFILEIRKDDLEGVYKRLAKREVSYDSEVLMPPDDVLTRWHKLFGGCLITFSAAVVERLGRLMEGNWKLTHGDAVKAVRRLYLRPLKSKPTEKVDLLRVAAMAKLELDTPEEALDDEYNPVEHAIKNGIVYRLEVGWKPYIYYHMIHPGLGELILAGAYAEPYEEVDIIIRIMKLHPYSTSYIQRCLFTSDDTKDVKPLLSTIVENRERLLFILSTPNLVFTHSMINRLVRLRLITYNDIDNAFSQDKAYLIDAALNTPLEHLAHFLKFANSNIIHTFDCVTSTLSEVDIDGELIYKAELLGKALSTPVNYLAHFLIFANEYDLPEIYEYITVTLNEEGENGGLIYQGEIVRSFSDTPLGDLAEFLKFAKTGIPKIFDALIVTLNSKEYRDKLVEKFMNARIEQLTSFVIYVKDKIEQVDLLPIFEAIEITEWDKYRDRLAVDQLDNIKNFADIATMYGLPELTVGPARNIIVKTVSREQHSETLGLHHISCALRFGRDVGDDEIKRFLDIIATEDWIDRQYKSRETKPGSIAAFLYSIWAYNSRTILKAFLTDVLKSRLESEFVRFYMLKIPKYISGKVQFIGIAALIGLGTYGMEVKLPGNGFIIEALNWPTPLDELDNLGHIQIQFWLGLRDLARLRPREISVPAVTGEKVLELWKEANDNIETEAETDAKPEIKRFKTLNADMIKWLEKCKANGWQLVDAPRIRIP